MKSEEVWFKLAIASLFEYLEACYSDRCQWQKKGDFCGAVTRSKANEGENYDHVTNGGCHRYQVTTKVIIVPKGKLLTIIIFA